MITQRVWAKIWAFPVNSLKTACFLLIKINNQRRSKKISRPPKFFFQICRTNHTNFSQNQPDWLTLNVKTSLNRETARGWLGLLLDDQSFSQIYWETFLQINCSGDFQEYFPYDFCLALRLELARISAVSWLTVPIVQLFLGCSASPSTTPC